MNTAQPAIDHATTLDRVRLAWAEVLDVAIAPDEVSFFRAGGDSLLLMVLLERLNEMTERDLEAADLFQHSTVLSQVELIEAPATRREPTELGATNRRDLLGRARRDDRGVSA